MLRVIIYKIIERYAKKELLLECSIQKIFILSLKDNKKLPIESVDAKKWETAKVVFLYCDKICKI